MLLFLALVGLVIILILGIFILCIIFGKSKSKSKSISNIQDHHISPLHLTDDSRDEYSVKLTNHNTGLVTIYSGRFVSDFLSRSICLQRIFMELIEITIQETICSNFRFTSFPNLGRPCNVILKPKDILVSFPDRGDYLIFGEDLTVSFYSVDTPVEIYEHQIDGQTFNFVSSYYNITYSGTYDTYGEFVINNSYLLNNNALTFNNTPIPKQTLSNGTVLYRGNKIYVTVLPSVLPSNIIVAGYIPGIFSSKKIQVNFTKFYNYIFDQYSFTSSEKSKLIPLLKELYHPMDYCIKYGIELKDRYTHSSNNSFASISCNDNTALEIRLS